MSADKIPFFRRDEFSKINLSICDGMKKLVFTKEDSEVAYVHLSIDDCHYRKSLHPLGKEGFGVFFVNIHIIGYKPMNLVAI
jgi:hypothetical protein